MKTNLIHLLAIIVHAASWFDAVEKPAPKPTPKPAVKASAEALQPVVTLWTFPGCGPCESLKKELAGIKGITVKTIVETGPYTHANYPVLTMDGRAKLVGFHPRSEVEKWIRGK